MISHAGHTLEYHTVLHIIYHVQVFDLSMSSFLLFLPQYSIVKSLSNNYTSILPSTNSPPLPTHTHTHLHVMKLRISNMELYYDDNGFVGHHEMSRFKHPFFNPSFAIVTPDIHVNFPSGRALCKQPQHAHKQQQPLCRYEPNIIQLMNIMLHVPVLNRTNEHFLKCLIKYTLRCSRIYPHNVDTLCISDNAYRYGYCHSNWSNWASHKLTSTCPIFVAPCTGAIMAMQRSYSGVSQSDSLADFMVTLIF